MTWENGMYTMGRATLVCGEPDRSLRDIVVATKLRDLRSSDLEELLDYLKAAGFAIYEIQRDFGYLLDLSLGLRLLDTRYYGIFGVDELLFLATISRHNYGDTGVLTLSGYALERAYEQMTKREITDAVSVLIGRIAWDMVDVYRTEYAVCHVKATNVRTLAMWRWLARKGPSNLKISILENPFTLGYKLVTLEVQ